jgi:hypothetical protein
MLAQITLQAKLAAPDALQLNAASCPLEFTDQGQVVWG